MESHLKDQRDRQYEQERGTEIALRSDERPEIGRRGNERASERRVGVWEGRYTRVWMRGKACFFFLVYQMPGMFGERKDCGRGEYRVNKDNQRSGSLTVYGVLGLEKPGNLGTGRVLGSWGRCEKPKNRGRRKVQNVSLMTPDQERAQRSLLGRGLDALGKTRKE